jgi:hypothetical protein
MDLPTLVDRLRADAQTANERRLLALTGDRETGIDAAYTAIAAAEADDDGRQSGNDTRGVSLPPAASRQCR